MATRNLTVTIKVKQDTSTNWTSKNSVLESGEFGFDTTNKILKIGDGVTAWNALSAIQFEGGGSQVVIYAAQSAESEKAIGYTRGGEIDKKLKSIETRLAALEGGN